MIFLFFSNFFQFFIFFFFQFFSSLLFFWCLTSSKMFGHMIIILFPVLCKCRTVLNKAKTTKFNNRTIKLFWYFDCFYFLFCLTSSKVSKKLTKIKDVRIFLIVIYYFVSWILQSITYFRSLFVSEAKLGPKILFYNKISIISKINENLYHLSGVVSKKKKS